MSLYLYLTETDQLRNMTVRRNTYSTQIETLERGVGEALDALSLFVDICNGTQESGLRSYDCHVADCGCHYRADMLIYLIQHYGGDRNKLMEIENYVSQLHQVSKRISEVQEKFKTMTNPREMCSALGIDVHAETVESLHTKLGIQVDSNGWYNNSTDTWDPNNPWMVCKFLTFAYVLRKYMKITMIDGNLIGRLHIKELGGNRVRKEFLEMQKCVSGLSMSYIQCIHEELQLPPMIKSLIEKTIAKSPKEVTTCSTYVGFMPLAWRWQLQKQNILVHIRRFCQEGFHNNYFVLRSHYQPKNQKMKGHKGEGKQFPPWSWDFEQVDHQELIARRSYHGSSLIIAGNSFDGYIDGYLQRMADTNCRKHDEDCEENTNHCKQLLKRDFTDILLHNIAQHEPYPFQYDEEKWETTLRDHCGEQFEEYKTYARNADSLGCGRKMDLFTIQHISAENAVSYVSLMQKMEKAVSL
ncbi:hypothetical protein K7432_004551 [Basidiobolus ranarum]|uniref:Uncharacterized protein n=1 Tax=Basidiobolus ranarum TaxID=34480 RepID=A0ABR2W4F1_9FUNG